MTTFESLPEKVWSARAGREFCPRCGKEILVEDAFNLIETGDGLAHTSCVYGVP